MKFYYILTKKKDCIAIDKFSDTAKHEIEQLKRQGFKVESEYLMATSTKDAVDNWKCSLYKKSKPMINFDLGRIYEFGRNITIPVVCIGFWCYTIFSWDWILGIGLGWFPSIFVAMIAGALWPLIALLLLLVVGLFVLLMNTA